MTNVHLITCRKFDNKFILSVCESELVVVLSHQIVKSDRLFLTELNKKSSYCNLCQNKIQLLLERIHHIPAHADFLKFVFILLDSTHEVYAGPSEFLPDLHFLCKIVLKPSNVISLLLV
jgi:hypothetical protein